MSESHTVRHTIDVLPADAAVLCVDAVGLAPLRALLGRFQLALVCVADNRAIPGSFWGDSEAGLCASTLYVRCDTPLHSALHEAGHFVCMDSGRRAALNTDAGGGYDEETAVCCWQIMATDWLFGVDRARMCADMDAWGYTFRLGSAAAWFAEDADDARAWLAAAGLIDAQRDTLCFAVHR